MRKLKYEEVNTIISQLGYKLLSTEYINSNTKLKVECPKHIGKEWLVTFSSLHNSKSKCPYCDIDNRRLSYEEVKSRIAKKGYILLSKEYINNHDKLKIQCPTHPDKEWWTCYDSICTKNSECPYCAGKILTYEYVKSKIEEKGYELISEIYKNSNAKLLVRCNKHPDKDRWVTYASLVLNNAGCAYCRSDLMKSADGWSWKGGISDLNRSIRSLLSNWRTEAFITQNRTCYISGVCDSKVKMVVHHPVNFTIIRDMALEELGFTKSKKQRQRNAFSEEEFDLIMHKINEYHVSMPGVVMTKEIHSIFHSIYGKKYNTLDQIEEFKIRYQSGEFDNIKE